MPELDFDEAAEITKVPISYCYQKKKIFFFLQNVYVQDKLFLPHVSGIGDRVNMHRALLQQRVDLDGRVGPKLCHLVYRTKLPIKKKPSHLK